MSWIAHHQVLVGRGDSADIFVAVRPFPKHSRSQKRHPRTIDTAIPPTSVERLWAVRRRSKSRVGPDGVCRNFVAAADDSNQTQAPQGDK